MLKRARPVSPVSGGSSYDDDEEQPRTKRVRFATGIVDASSSRDRDRNARQERGLDEEHTVRVPNLRGRRAARSSPQQQQTRPVEDGGGASDEESSSDEEIAAPTQRYSRSPPPPERTSPTSTTFSEYTTINSLLGALNRSRTDHHKSIAAATLTPPTNRRLPKSEAGEGSSEGGRHRPTVPSRKTVPAGVPALKALNGQSQPNLGVLGWRHGRATAHRHRPTVPSPLSRAAISNEDEDDGAAETAVKWESELVRQRYEETNKLLKSLILSRRPAPEELEDEEE
ncbi:hypothetical protein M407DRAFT_244868 [Tulasnella calospora MUT 4182]|uniref:Uncharacterized protein n=1 Tax=Tulasnella calospora MUT 4182 TaxID=1051891 RepID=A0A0C3LP05_9AGAM|nr:hypothetical protein M407DRAFT_244868 [Tulasnella calospora MUT 4182]